MLAMQYRFVLPADYDMTIIQRRIDDNGYKMAGFPGLIFKAWLYACKAKDPINTDENVYAPFYLWQDAESMHGFLSGAGFKKLTEDFGWPQVHTFPVLSARLSPEFVQAGFASLDVSTVPAYADLAGLMQPPKQVVALARVSALDTVHWRHIDFCLWATAPAQDSGHFQRYQVGHLSVP
ncbi:DUF4865 family protein (plasmid) [Pantoea ananatis]|uniref:DUF4865 family protein n=1 Tax=Pantoea ananas TaxID=553 RepID=UPI00207A4D44|nr:DUF4865 family protein [Pantoea ananatis]MCW0353717.1 hypothetical protein [Pantoea ananatis]USL60675.1 DUF4865 family protein [Pantoea ananatis]